MSRRNLLTQSKGQKRANLHWLGRAEFLLAGFFKTSALNCCSSSTDERDCLQDNALMPSQYPCQRTLGKRQGFNVCPFSYKACLFKQVVFNRGSRHQEGSWTIFDGVARRYLICTAVLRLLCSTFIWARWVIGGCCDGSRHKKRLKNTDWNSLWKHCRVTRKKSFNGFSDKLARNQERSMRR